MRHAPQTDFVETKAFLIIDDDAAAAALQEKLADAQQAPGFRVEFDPTAAERVGAFAEDLQRIGHMVAQGRKKPSWRAARALGRLLEQVRRSAFVIIRGLLCGGVLRVCCIAPVPSFKRYATASLGVRWR